MNFRKLGLLYFFTVIWLCQTNAQILDDSTQLVYGPETTRYTYESNIKFNREFFYQVDTLLDDLHRYSIVDRNNYTFQNLGNLGTALHPVFYQVPDVIGGVSGFTAYDAYFKNPQDFRYFDTKSPYTKLYAVIGGENRSVVDIDFSRNVNPNWNLGISFTSIVADKQLGTTGNPDDRNTNSVGYTAYTRYHTKDSAYQVLANFSRLSHEIDEIGGIRPGEQDVIPDDLFDYEDENVWLSNAESKELKTNYHIYHQYHLSDFIQVFHSFDRTKQKVTFGDFPLSAGDGEFFDQVLIDPDTTMEKSTFRLVQNQLGLKGNISDLFYSIYVKRRDVKFIYAYLDPVGFDSENYGGFDLRYDLNHDTYLDLYAEYELGGNHKLGANMKSKYLEASYKRVRYEPSFIQKDYFGNHDEWHNNFKAPQSDNLKATLKLDLPFIMIQPHVSLSNINDFIFYNREARPEQASGSAQIISPGLDFHIDFLKYFHLDNNVVYTKVTGPSADIFRVPEIFANVNLYYANFLFNDKLQVRIGLDTHYQTAYFANDYDPVIMQFFLQNDFEIPEYITSDFYINFKVRSARIFVKFTNITELAGFNEGYFTTPFYTAQKGTFDLGINWQFFD